MHDEVEGLFLGALQLLLRKVLVPFQQLGGQHHVASLTVGSILEFVRRKLFGSYLKVHLVDAMDVSKGSGN